MKTMNPKTVRFSLQLALTLMTCAFLIVPVFQSVLAGLTVNFFVGIKSGLTLRWLGEVWSLYHDTIFRTFLIAGSCLLVNLLIGVPAAYALHKSRSRWKRVVEEILVVPLAIPGLAIALALLISYGGWTAFRRSGWIILAGHVIFTLPFLIRSVIAVMSSFNLHELEESAASLGAGFRRRFLGIVIPNAMPGILAGSLMVFTLSVGEFNLTWMLHTPLTKTLPVGLADSYASMRLEVGSAYTILFFFMIVPLLVAMQWVSSPENRKFAMSFRKSSAMGNLLESETDSNAHASAFQMEEGGAALTVAACAKTFPDGTRALTPVDLSVAAGETLVILGPSGCGKTTLLRIIAGLESPNPGGLVRFDDEDVTDVPIERRRVGMVFQNYALFPNMDVSENIGYGLKIRGDDPESRKARVADLLRMMRITELAGRKIDQLSGGQKQRVALARALAAHPRLLLLDEPLTALDAKLREELRGEIDRLLRTVGITAVYVTHDQSEAMALGDRIVVMDRGRIAQIGAPREIYFRPANRFVAEFVGTLNRLTCPVAENRLRMPEAEIPLEELTRVHPGGKAEAEIHFRPEHAAIVAEGEGHLRGKVVSTLFLGDRTRVVLNGLGSDEIRVEASGGQSFSPGETVDVRLDTEAVFTLEGEGNE
jgi:putative spermidine/putrescine transport system ATP-binding protein